MWRWRTDGQKWASSSCLAVPFDHVIHVYDKWRGQSLQVHKKIPAVCLYSHRATPQPFDSLAGMQKLPRLPSPGIMWVSVSMSNFSFMDILLLWILPFRRRVYSWSTGQASYAPLGCSLKILETYYSKSIFLKMPIMDSQNLDEVHFRAVLFTISWGLFTFIACDSIIDFSFLKHGTAVNIDWIKFYTPLITFWLHDKCDLFGTINGRLPK